MPLTPFWHIWNVDRAAHEASPRLLCERLHGDKLPELPFCHDNFGYAVVKNPVLKCGEASLLAIGEHGIGYGFFHEPVSLVRRCAASFCSCIQCYYAGSTTKAQVVRPKEGVYKLYTPVLNEF